MSKQSIHPTEVEGISTPATLVDGQRSVNQIGLSKLLLAADDELIGWIETSVNTFAQLEELFKAIQAATIGRSDANPAAQLRHISKLAAIGAYVASDIANGADCGRERFQELAAPFRASVGGAQ